MKDRSVSGGGLESGHLPEGIPIYFGLYQLKEIDNSRSKQGCGCMDQAERKGWWSGRVWRVRRQSGVLLNLVALDRSCLWAGKAGCSKYEWWNHRREEVGVSAQRLSARAELIDVCTVKKEVSRAKE